MTPVELSRTVLRAMRHAVDAGELCVDVPERVKVEPPRPGGCGDYATNLALRVARDAGRPPREVAELLSPWLAAEAGIAGVDITGPGFLNITLAGAPAEALVRDILRCGESYGHVRPDTGALAQLHTPHEVRAVVVADSARRILRSQGVLVRVTSDAAPDREWVDTLGVRVDAYGRPPEPLPTLRPVPAPADPLRLGRDAGRWALLHPAAHDHPRITPEQGGDEHLAQRETNPLFRVRYAHARSRALTRNAAALGFDSAPGPLQSPAPDEAASHELLGHLAAHPPVLAAAARDRAPDRLARHLVAIADGLLAYQHTVLPLGDEKPSAAHRARLALAEAAGTVLAGGLSLLGVSAPDYL
ncbi:ArgS-related anticodon-binding protein NrtL [Streptomyces sp. NRRL S-920]|uniref:ArgS-related anticodon-binding protein NrtL n=1 Tax=Streptomyces sp. NRRL S-920 TaxID=1463921 RepID=UPI0004C57F1D|nr:DALR anticodon-binding domain-containing protein [Streptomyces sp. NRRL S-920]